MATYTVFADEINFKSGMFHSFEECRQFVENSKALNDCNKIVVIEDNGGEITKHEYFKIVIHE